MIINDIRGGGKGGMDRGVYDAYMINSCSVTFGLRGLNQPGFDSVNAKDLPVFLDQYLLFNSALYLLIVCMFLCQFVL